MIYTNDCHLWQFSVCLAQTEDGLAGARAIREPDTGHLRNGIL